MKKFNLIAIILVAASVCVLMYNFLLVQPYLFDPTEEDYRVGFNYELLSHYRHISDYCGLIGTSLAGIGSALGLIAVIKGKNKAGWLSVLAGLTAGILNFVVSFAHVI